MNAPPAELALGTSLVVVLVAVSAIDLERRVIPNRVLAAGATVGVAIAAVAAPQSIPERAIAAVAAGGFLLLAALSRRGGMGIGDVKLAAVMGLYLGAEVGVALLVALALGGVAGLALIIRHGPEARERTLAFAPYLAVGGIVALLIGEGIVDWYLDGVLGDSPRSGA